MSDIPSYIFIRMENSTIAATTTLSLVDHQRAIHLLPSLTPHHHQQHSPATTAANSNSDVEDSISLQDLAAMKRMVREISQDPTLLVEKCNIPQLSHSMMTTTNDRAWAAYRGFQAKQEQHDDDDEEEEEEVSSMSDDDHDHEQHRYLSDAANNDAASSITPPPQEPKLVLLATTATTTTTAHYKNTPETQDTTLVSGLLLSPATVGRKRLELISPPPFGGMPFYCQECNGSPSTSAPPVQQLPAPSMARQPGGVAGGDGRDVRSSSSSNSVNAVVGMTTTSMAAMPFPSVATARSA